MSQFNEIGNFFLCILPNRQFDHPFIPLSFHWRVCNISANHETGADSAGYINTLLRGSEAAHNWENHGFLPYVCPRPDRFITICCYPNLNTPAEETVSS